MELSEKMKMLGTSLYLKKFSKQAMASIMLTLENDEQVDDMVWYMGQHPQAGEEELLAVAFQLVKDARDSSGKKE